VKIRYFILVLSDKAYKGLRKDECIEAVKSVINNASFELIGTEILPDELELIKRKLEELADSGKADLIITSGGTGVSPRDVTPDATLKVIEKRIQGMEYAMVMEALKHTPRGSISRAVVGIRNETLIVNLPGSPKAVKENLNAIINAIPHAIEKLKGSEKDCH
jgi:molybdenum cofactor synthesis domain-containing protein